MRRSIVRHLAGIVSIVTYRQPPGGLTISVAERNIVRYIVSRNALIFRDIDDIDDIDDIFGHLLEGDLPLCAIRLGVT